MSTWADTPRSRSRAFIFATTLALLFVFVLSVPAFAADLVVDGAAGCSDVTGSPSYCHIQAAINAASPGDTVLVKNGTYPESLDIYKSLTLVGESEAGVLINASTFADYGIDASDNVNPANFVFRNFTLDGPDGNVSGRYGLKIWGNQATATIENVTVINSGRSGVDLNGLNGTLVRNVTSTNNGGAGIALTDVTNMTLEDLTTSGNAWGGLALYAKGAFATANTSNIVLQGVNSFSEARGVYIEPTAPAVVKFVSLAGFDYVVQNAAAPGYYFLKPDAAAAAAFANASFPAGTSVIAPVTPNATYAGAGVTLQAMINAAAAGDTLQLAPKLYAENVTITKHVKLVGAGSGSDAGKNTVLRPASGDVVVITGSGVSNSNPLLLKNLRVETAGAVGVDLRNSSFVRFENVQIVGDATAHGESEICLRVDKLVSVSDLAIINSGFSQCDYGWYFFKSEPADWVTGGTYVRNVTVSNSTFVENSYKGIYVEKLSDAAFVDCVVRNNGPEEFWNRVWNGGFDVNLKGHEQYRNLIFKNLYMGGNGLGAKEGAALMIKARDDGSYAGTPASLDNVVIEGGVFTGNERGIRIGEPGKNNAGPTNVVIHNASIYGNASTYSGVDGSAYGGLINQSTAAVNAESNWWGSASGPSGDGPGTGEAVRNAGSGSIDFDPWLGAAPAAALIIPSTPIDLPTSGATSFSLPINVNPAAGSFSSVAFSVDYDQTCLSINPADANGDGIPEAISGLPGGFVNSVMLNTADGNGELDIAMWDVTPPLATLPVPSIASIQFTILPACQGPVDHTTFVKFSAAPAPSFSDADGVAIYRATQGADPLLLDYNAAPTDITLGGSSVAENTPAGAEVGTLAVVDADGNPSVLTLVPGCAGGDADNAAFTVAGNKLLTAATFDFETDSAKSVCVQADDGLGGVYAKALAVSISNVNEPPTNITLTGSTVVEGATIGTGVGAFSTSGDPETAQTHSYALTIGGDGSADNGKFSIDGSQLKTAAAVDFATQSVYYIRVRSTDNGLPAQSVEKQFVINVLDHSLLSIENTAVVRHGQAIGVPVLFTANGNAPTSVSFGVSYNAACLAFVNTTPAGGTASGGVVSYSASGAISTGTLVTLNFTAIASCPSGTSVPLVFTAPSLNGGALPVSTDNGAVLVISNSARGDCNSDGFVNAGDFSAIVLETFDTDEPWWLYAPQSTFPGSPVGCDANASQYIDVADVVCTVLVVFGNSSCTGGSLLASDAGEPAVLAVAPSLDGAAVNVPVSLTANGADVAGAAFTLTYDPQQAVFDESDADGDGLPDAVLFATAGALRRSVSVDAANGRIKVAVYGLTLPLPAIEDGVVATVRLQAQGDAPLAGVSVIGAALGNTSGNNTPVEVEVGGTSVTRSWLYLPAVSN